MLIGEPITVSVAVSITLTVPLPFAINARAALPVAPLVEATNPMELLYIPDAAPVTVTLNWHWLLTLIVAPDKAMPVGAVVVSVPPHMAEDDVATVSPVGRVSLNATPFSGTALAAGFVRVKVRVLVAPGRMVAGLKACATSGAVTTSTLAEAVVPAPPSFETTMLVVLFWVPAAMPFTFTEKVQELAALSATPDRLTTLVACVAVIVPPPQEPLKPLGVEMIRPAGKVSLKPTPVSPTVVFTLLMVKLSEVEPLSGMLDAANELLIVGGATTVMLALEMLPVPPSVELA